MKAAVSILACFASLLCFPFTGLADKDCPSESALLDFLKTEAVPSVPLLPAAAKVAEDFAPGRGGKAGTVRNAAGTVLALHQGGSTAYKLEKGRPVFNGDTIITGQDSRVTLLLLDKSLLTLTPQSKMVLDQSVYNRGTGSRDTRLQLLLGRLRTIVSKITGENSYFVRTPTAAAGARGTDFALAVAPAPDAPDQMLTALVTGSGSSTVELTSTAGGSVMVGPLSVASAPSDCPVCPAVKVGQAAAGALRTIAPELEAAAAADAKGAAAWERDFTDDFDMFGLDRAVENALAGGIEPEAILAFVVSRRDKFLLWSTLKALYCANISRSQITDTAARLGISEEELGSTFAESMVECGSKLALQDRDVLEVPETDGHIVSPSRP